MCNCNNNQTPKEVYDYLKSLSKKGAKLKENTNGTGLFVVPAPELGILETRIILVENLPFGECARRGSNCIAFKWIPQGYKTAVEIKKIRARCSDNWCGPNDSWCPELCFCGSGTYCR